MDKMRGWFGIVAVWLVCVGVGAQTPSRSGDASKAAPIQIADPAKEFDAIRVVAEAGQKTNAVARLKALARSHSGWARIDEVQLLLGTLLVQTGDIAAGKALLDQIVDRAPEGSLAPSAFFYRGQAQESLGDFRNAVLSYDVVLRKFASNALAPSAALRQAILVEKVVGNPRRAREIYEQFVQQYPQHPLLAAVRNHLGLVAEQAGEMASAVKFYLDYAAKHPDDPGDPSMNGSAAGACAAALRGAALASGTLNDVPAALAAYKQYEGLPRAVKGEGFHQAALLLVQKPEAGDAKSMFEAALQRQPLDAWRMEYGRWLASQKKDDEAAAQFMAVAETSADTKQVDECVNSLSPERAKALMDRRPRDFGLAKRGLAKFAASDQRAAGRAILDACLARGDIDWKTAIARQWWTLTGEAEDAMRIVRAADEEGDMAASAAASLASADRLLTIHDTVAKSPWIKMRHAGALAGEVRFGRTNEALAVHARIYDQRNSRGKAKWEQTNFELFASMPGSPLIRQVIFEPRTPDGPMNVTFYERGVTQQPVAVECQFTPLQDTGFELLALVPLSFLKLDPKADQVRLECASWVTAVGTNAPAFVTLFESAQAGAPYTNNTKYGTVTFSDLTAGISAGKLRNCPTDGAIRRRADSTARARDVLVASLKTWSAYPDFPRVGFAARLASVARYEPARMPDPATLAPWGQPANSLTPTNIPSPDGTASRKAAVALMKEYKLNVDPLAAGLVAGLQYEADPRASAEDLFDASVRLIRAGLIEEASPQVVRLFKALPEHDPRIVDVIGAAASHGKGDWEKVWGQTLVPAATAEIKFYEAVSPQTEASRLARVRLAGVLNAKISVALHEEFLNEHGSSAQAPAVRRRLFHEMKRAGLETKTLVTQSLDSLDKNPGLILSVPSESIPAGPDGYIRCVTNMQAAIKANAGLAPALLLKLAEIHRAFSRLGEAAECLRDILAKHGSSPEAAQAKEAMAGLFDRNYFGAGVAQKDADDAFAWQFDRALGQESLSFSPLSSNLWRLACHPAYRLHGLHEFDSLYMYSAHQAAATATVGDFLAGVYGGYPGDGSGPFEKAAFSGWPFRSGDRFLMYGWALLRAPVDGGYGFWFGADDWVGIEIDGQPFNIPDQKQGSASLALSRGLHLFRLAYVDAGNQSSMQVDWQPPGGARTTMGAEAFSAERNPLILSLAAATRGAGGVGQWNAYLQKFPRDGRGRMMRLASLALADPAAATAELTTLVQKYPGNWLYRDRLADCLWRQGRTDEALQHYQALAAERTEAAWIPGFNAQYREIFLRGREPSAPADEFLDRVRARGVWPAWLAPAVRASPANGEIAARLQAADHLDTLMRQDREWQATAGWVETAMTKETAQVAAARGLISGTNAAPSVKAQAATAAAAAEARVKVLQQEMDSAQKRAKAAADSLAGLRAALGIGAEQPSYEVYLNAALAAAQKVTLDPTDAYLVASRLWGAAKQESARPFLDYILKYSPRNDLVGWAGECFVQLAGAGKDVGSAAETLSSMGWRAPKDPTCSEWIRRSCDLALQSGDVSLFARNANLLATLYPSNATYVSYIDRLGEVFEKAGNVVSAENEHMRVIRTMRDPARKRTAQLALATLYQKEGRWLDSLKVLSVLARLDVPEDKKERGKPAAKRPTPPVAEQTEGPAEGGKQETKAPEEDAVALLLAARAYIEIERPEWALDAYARASRQASFGTAIVPPQPLLLDLARACLGWRVDSAASKEQDKEDPKLKAVPLALVEAAQRAIAMVDAAFRFYGDKMTLAEKTEATLLRADANIMMRNYPRAIEEVRAAKQAAGDTPAQYLADLKMGEIQLASENADQALPVFRKLARMNLETVSPLALFWEGTTHLRANRRDEAIDCFRILWERYAESELVRRAVYAIARTYAEQGAFLEAIRLYEAVGAINSMPKEKVVPGDVLTVKVWDADHYLGTGQYTIPVKVNVPSGDSEDLLLEMNKINHSLFLGTIRTELGAPKPGDGILQVCGTDLVYVTYEDRFRGVTEGTQATAANVRGGRQTSVIQVVQDGDLKISPTVFVEEKDEEEDLYREKTQEEAENDQRLAALGAQLQRGEAVVRPGNAVYIRLEDADMDRSSQTDKTVVTVFTYSPQTQVKAGDARVALQKDMARPRGAGVSDGIPSNGEFSWSREVAPPPGDRPRLDTVNIEVSETGPHTGIFYGQVKTAVNGPTALASDQSADNVAACAIDGSNDARTAWIGFMDGKPGKWIEIDLKELYDVSRIVWDRGQGADDRYMIDYTVSLRGTESLVEFARTNNASAHTNAIVLPSPVKCRWIRFTARKYNGDAPAISEIAVFTKDGVKVTPPAVSPLARTRDDVLDFNVGDCMSGEYMDDENVKPGAPVKRVSNALGVANTDGHIDAVFLSNEGDATHGQPIYLHNSKGDRRYVYVRRTKRVAPDGVLQIAVADPDLDVDDQINTVECEVLSSAGDRATVTAKEIEETAAIFAGRIQLSPSPEAKDDASRLWVRDGDWMVLRYLDQENRHPGHAVYRESFIFAARDELGDFPGGTVLACSPRSEEGSLYPPNWCITLRDSDRAVPSIDRVPLQVLSFATGDRARFELLLQDLDGTFSGRLPVVIGDRPEVPAGEGATPEEGRRIRPIDDWWQSRNRDAFDVPLAVSGDDIVWTGYQDPKPAEAAARATVAVAPVSFLSRLATLVSNAPALPEAAKREGITVTLRDPYQCMQELNRARESGVLREIARKKRQYAGLLKEYRQSIERLGASVQELRAKEPASASSSAAKAASSNAASITGADAPLTVAEELTGGSGLSPEDVSVQDVIRATALRRDRDALMEAHRALEARLESFGKYDTAATESELAKEEAAAREAQKAQPAEKAAESEPAKASPPPWYVGTNWWRECGGIVPGSLLNVRVEDPDLAGTSTVVRVALMGGNNPAYLDFPATPVDGKLGVFEARIPTAAEAIEGGLALNGVRCVLLTYVDACQSKFPPKRANYMSLASDASVRITGPDFVKEGAEHHVGADLCLVVEDADMDKTSVRDFVWVDVESERGDRERALVRETQGRSGLFRGVVPTEFGEPKPNDGVLQCGFGGRFSVQYVDELWCAPGAAPPVVRLTGTFMRGGDGQVEIFARQLRGGTLQRDVLFNTALAEYELGNSSVEMGAVLKGRRHLTSSREKFQFLVEQYPDDPVCAHATYYLGNINFLLGDYPGAVESLQRVVTRWPKSEFKAMALFKLGACHIKAKHFDKAVESFVNLAYHHAESPLVADAMLMIAQHFSNEKLYNDAIAVGESFIRKFPEHEKTANVYLRVAGWLILEKKYAAAVGLFDQAEKQMPDSPQVPAFLYWHADCLFKTASPSSVDYKKALVLLQRITYDYPDSKWASYASARLVEMDTGR